MPLRAWHFSEINLLRDVLTYLLLTESILLREAYWEPTFPAENDDTVYAESLLRMMKFLSLFWIDLHCKLSTQLWKKQRFAKPKYVKQVK